MFQTETRSPVHNIAASRDLQNYLRSPNGRERLHAFCRELAHSMSLNGERNVDDYPGYAGDVHQLGIYLSEHSCFVINVKSGGYICDGDDIGFTTNAGCEW